MLNHVGLSTSNLNNLSKSFLTLIRNKLETFNQVEPEELLTLMKTFKAQYAITLSDFDHLFNEVEVDKETRTYLTFITESLNSAYNSLDELIYLVEKNEGKMSTSLRLLIKRTVSLIDDVIGYVHKYLSMIREQENKQ